MQTNISVKISDIDYEKAVELLKKEVERRFGNLDFSDKKVKNKVFGFFLRRGFSARDILCAMNAEEDYE